MTAQLRIQKELTNHITNPIDGIRLSQPNIDDLYNLTAEVNGPSDTPYEGGTFLVKI